MSFRFRQDVEIDIELAPGDQTAIPKTKEQAERDTGNQLHMLTNRHDKFLDSLREVKVRTALLQRKQKSNTDNKQYKVMFSWSQSTA